jgi:dephospho-CoA kinase
MIFLKVIGVTGGIGSGKSAVARTLRDLGAVVIDADSIARAVTSKGGKAFEELVAYFGNGILDENGELNRKKLAELVFKDPVGRHALESITHKHIVSKIVDGVENIRNSGRAEIVVIDAPLPVEHGFVDLSDEVWVVTAEKDTRIKRAMERSGYTREEALDRIGSQMKDEEYLQAADEVLPNDGTMEELEKAVVKLFIQKKQDWQRQ